ncbi:hypothetical protein HK096_009468, partial [Nowakowskiella sp. JEL0078]
MSALRIVATELAPKALGPYSQAIVANGFIYTAGQIALDPKTMEVVKGGVKSETLQVFTNLKYVLEEAGSSLSQVIKSTVFLRDMNDFGAMNEVYAEAFGDHKPARSTIQVARLPKDVAVEIELRSIVTFYHSSFSSISKSYYDPPPNIPTLADFFVRRIRVADEIHGNQLGVFIQKAAKVSDSYARLLLLNSRKNVHKIREHGIKSPPFVQVYGTAHARFVDLHQNGILHAGDIVEIRLISSTAKSVGWVKGEKLKPSIGVILEEFMESNVKDNTNDNLRRIGENKKSSELIPPKFVAKSFLTTIRNSIVYRDDDILVLNKPNEVHLYRPQNDLNTKFISKKRSNEKFEVIASILEVCSDLQFGKKGSPIIVSELDHRVSGAVILARNQQSYDKLLNQKSTIIYK